MFCKIFLFFSCAAGEGVNMGGHDGFHYLEYMVACAMAGVEMGIGVISRQSLCQICNLFVRLQTVEQVETSYNGVNGPRTCRQNVFQSVMSTAGKQQSVGVEF